MIPEVRQTQEVLHQNGLEQTIDRYERSDSFLVLSKNTRYFYRHDLTQFQEYCQANAIQTINGLTSESVENWGVWLKQYDYAPATINRRLSSLSNFLGWARREGLLQTDSIGALAENRMAVVKEQPRTLTTEQVETLILKAKNLRDASLILITLATGANITEILSLNREDVLTTGDGNIAIRFEGGVKKVKTRTLQIDKKTGSKITEYIEDSGLKPEDPLFQGYTSDRSSLRGHRLARASVYLILKRDYSHEIGVENLSPRMLRDTFIANFKGTPRELAEVLGRKR